VNAALLLKEKKKSEQFYYLYNLPVIAQAFCV